MMGSKSINPSCSASIPARIRTAILSFSYKIKLVVISISGDCFAGRGIAFLVGTPGLLLS